jgi:hypothetical protein
MEKTALLKIVNPSEDNYPALKRFLKNRFDDAGQMLIYATVKTRPRDAFVAVDGSRVVGFASFQRMTSGTAAVANLRTSQGFGKAAATDSLLKEVIVRAKETLHRHVTCIPSKSGLPSPETLKANGFTKWLTRETFSGATAKSFGMRITEVKSQSQSADIIQRLPRGQALQIDFRSVPLTIASLAELLNKGVLLDDGPTTGGLAGARISRAIALSEDRAYFIPTYMEKAVAAKLREFGEVSILSESDPTKTVLAASDWLHGLGVGSMYIYFKSNKAIGMKMSELGYRYMGSHDVWSFEVSGPMDQFLS